MPRRLTERPGPEQAGQWEPWLVALDAQIAAEDREDRRARDRQRRLGLPDPETTILTPLGHPDAGTEPRWVDGQATSMRGC